MVAMKKTLLLFILFFHSSGFAYPVKILFKNSGFSYALLNYQKGVYDLTSDDKDLNLNSGMDLVTYNGDKIIIGSPYFFNTKIYDSTSGREIGEQEGITIYIDRHKNRFYYGNTEKEPILYKTDSTGNTVPLPVNIPYIKKIVEIGTGNYLFSQGYDLHLYLIDKELRPIKLITKKCKLLGVISKKSQIVCYVRKKRGSFIHILTQEGKVVKKISLDGERPHFYIDEKELIYATSTYAFYKFPFTFFPEYQRPTLITLDGEIIPVERKGGLIRGIPRGGIGNGIVIPSHNIETK